MCIGDYYYYITSENNDNNNDDEDDDDEMNLNYPGLFMGHINRNMPM